MQPTLVRTLGLLAGLLLLPALGQAQPMRPTDRLTDRPTDRLEPGVLVPMGEPDYGVISWADRLEPGVLSVAASELEPGLLGQNDPLFVRAPFSAPCRGRCPDVLEPGVLGPHNELESGLLGQSDPLLY